MKLFVSFFLLIGVSALAFAQEPAQKHPIDKWLEECMDKNPTTVGMVNCEDEALKRWDKELNSVYKQLMEKLSAQAKETLKEAQRAWLKARDAEIKLIGAVYGSLEGTMYIPMRADAVTSLTRARALKLKDYLDLLNEQSQ
jgi:uncharacterized protein YecT (DUF1311 family)